MGRIFHEIQPSRARRHPRPWSDGTGAASEPTGIRSQPPGSRKASDLESGRGVDRAHGHREPLARGRPIGRRLRADQLRRARGRILRADTRWPRPRSVANPSLGTNPGSAAKIQGNPRMQRSGSREMVRFRPHIPGPRRGFPLGLITGNRCATSGELLAGQNFAPWDCEPIPRATRKPQRRRDEDPNDLRFDGYRERGTHRACEKSRFTIPIFPAELLQVAFWKGERLP